jgi:hypothetical protein
MTRTLLALEASESFGEGGPTRRAYWAAPVLGVLALWFPETAHAQAAIDVGPRQASVRAVAAAPLAPAPAAPARAPAAPNPGGPIPALPEAAPAPAIIEEPPMAAPAEGGAQSAAVAPSGSLLAVDRKLQVPIGADAAAPSQPASVPSAEHAGVRLRAQAGMVRRSLSFDQDVYHRMRSLAASAFVYRLDAAVYPTFQWRALDGHVGLIGGYEGTLSGSVSDQNFGGSYDISQSEVYAGVRLRRSVRGQALGFEVTVGRSHAGLKDGKAQAGVPDVGYGEVRSAIDLTLHFDRLSATAAAGLRVPFGYGEMSNVEWFPRVGGYGMEGSLRGSYQISSLTAVEAAFTLRRYVLEMNSEPEDAIGGVSQVVGGAIDQYVTGYIGVSVAL